MENMKSYTDIGQSRKLAEILPVESADMFYTLIDQGLYLEVKQGIEPSKDDIPCWSLTELLDILPLEVSINKQTDGVDTYYYIASCDARYCDIHSHRHINPIDACYEMIIKLNELKLL